MELYQTTQEPPAIGSISLNFSKIKFIFLFYRYLKKI
jgi:hypothetical protein